MGVLVSVVGLGFEKPWVVLLSYQQEDPSAQFSELQSSDGTRHDKRLGLDAENCIPGSISLSFLVSSSKGYCMISWYHAMRFPSLHHQRPLDWKLTAQCQYIMC